MTPASLTLASSHPPLTLADVLPALIAPFPTNQVEVKPGATNHEKTRALALIYLKVQAIEQRLDDLVGVAHWTTELIPWDATGILCRLTILGVSKQASGEGEAGDANCKTSAEAQAFKRAFTRFGCRYAYTAFPRSAWFDYDAIRRGFANPAAVIVRLYEAAGLQDYIAEETRELARRAERSRAGRAEPDLAPPPAPHRAHIATRAPDARSITPKQLALLADRNQLEAARARFGVARLDDLTFAQASTLIAALTARAGA